MKDDSKIIPMSLFDPSRPTVGYIANQALMSQDRYPLIVGDLSNEAMKGFCDDVNEALVKDPFNGKVFFVVVHEKKDLVQRNRILRRVISLAYRPLPEDDTVVFRKNPKTGELWFCWCLPHNSEMDNMIHNSDKFEESMIQDILAYRMKDWKHFGFHLDKDTWKETEPIKDKKLA